MSAPGAGKTTLLEAVARRAFPACASACSRATCRASLDADRLAALAHAGRPAQHRLGLRRRMPPRRQHGPLGDPGAAARRDRPADRRERRQPRLPGRVPDRRGRPRDGLLGHRGRGQAAQVPADVPRLRAGGRQQDRPARRTSTSTSTGCSTTSTRSTPTCERMLRQRADRRGGRRVARLAGADRSRARPSRYEAVRRSLVGPAERLRTLLERAHRGERALLRRAGRAARAALPPDGGALRPRRAAGRVRALACGALGRPPRGGRVRPSR